MILITTNSIGFLIKRDGGTGPVISQQPLLKQGATSSKLIKDLIDENGLTYQVDFSK